MAIDNLLKFIKDKESYGGNYNIMARDKASANRNLTSKTIKEVLKEQAKNNNRAAGAYQIIPSTMKALMKRMGLTGDEVFDEKMQDAMAVELLKQRGLDDVTAGKITPEEFGNSLAKEWASLPLVTDVKNKKAGTSYYQGKSDNTSLVKQEEMPFYKGMLNALGNIDAYKMFAMNSLGGLNKALYGMDMPTMTNKDFNPGTLKALQEATKNALMKGKRSIDYEDYQNVNGVSARSMVSSSKARDKALGDNIVSKTLNVTESDPANAIYSVGGGRLSIDDNGDVYLTDEYDFSKIPFSSIKDGYGLARYMAGLLSPDQGMETRIKVGNVKTLLPEGANVDLTNYSDTAANTDIIKTMQREIGVNPDASWGTQSQEAWDAKYGAPVQQQQQIEDPFLPAFDLQAVTPQPAERQYATMEELLMDKGLMNPLLNK